MQATVNSHGNSTTNNNNLWYTPEHIVEAVRDTLIHIDLDPASDVNANEVVGAETIFTEDDNGLDLVWYGSVFLNPPFSRDLFSPFISKGIKEFNSDRVKSMVVLCNNNTDSKAIQSLMEHSTMVCFTRGRLAFRKPDGQVLRGNSKGQMIVLLTNDHATSRRFYKSFKTVGKVMANPDRY